MGLLGTFLNDSVQLTNSYRIYTRRYDREVDAEELSSVLGPLDAKSQAALDAAWKEYGLGLAGWKTKCGFQMMDLATKLREGLSSSERNRTLVCVLMDQSGSMRGQKMLLAGMAADTLQAGLSGIGIRSEVLGFTTIGWHGGRSRRRWNWLGRKKNPGRLCDLLHIVYKAAADERASTDGWAFHEMLRPDLPRENVDGEALEWAVSRMRARAETRKVLVVISDGAPVDDSTLLANNLEYLSNHLQSVIGQLVADGDITLCALGLAHDVQSYYSVCENIEVPENIFPAISRLLETSILPLKPSLPESSD